jgi:hypothetical protein
VEVQLLEADPINAAIAAAQRPADLTFKVITGAMTASLDETTGKKSLHCTASSTVEDLHGDVMTEDCVRDMAKQAKAKAMTIFLNHRYSVPEDVFGKTVSSQVLTRTTDPDTGKDVWDMDLDIDLAGSNPRTEKTWALIKDDMVRLGVSIGALIEEFDFKDKELGWWGGLIIKRVKLLEASIVGIPANQRSWVQNSVIAIGKSLGMSEEQIRARIKGQVTSPVTVHKIEANGVTRAMSTSTRVLLDGKDVTDEVTLDVTTKEADVNPDGTITLEADGPKNVIINGVPIMVPGAVYEQAEDDSVTKVADPGTPEALAFIREWGDETSVTPLTLSTAQIKLHREKLAELPSPETAAAPEGETSAEDAATNPDPTAGETPASDAALESAKTAAGSLSVTDDQKPLLEIVLGALEAAAGEVASLRNALTTKTEELTKVTAERDQALIDVKAAAEIVETLAKLPIGRKATFAGEIQGFRSRFAGMYDDDFLRMLESQER